MKLLDAFCCGGGIGSGFMRAGWNVTGVDTASRFRKYYPGTFILADAVEFIANYGHEYDAIHASPPCQGYSRGNAGRATDWPLMIGEVRAALESTGRPWSIENVEDAAWDMRDPVKLCGCMFDLSTIDTDGIRVHLQRPRLFETNWGLTAPRACDHSTHEWVAGAYGGARRDKYEAKYVRKGGYVPRDKAVVKALLGLDHDLTWEAMFECVPPAYGEWIGTELLAHLKSEAAA